MSAQFWPCSGCSRHVKRGDAICPFCGATASVDIGPTRVLAGRLSRAAIFAAGAVGVGIATTDCAPSFVSEYGAPCPTPCEVETEDATAGEGSTAPDAGDASATTGPTDSSSTTDVPMLFEPAYGSPVIDDASTLVPVYGAPAPDE